MHTVLKVISLTGLLASSCIYSNEHYDITMKLGESHTITLNSKQLADDRSSPGNKIIFPHLWRLDGYDKQDIIHLDDETTGEKNTRVYDLKSGLPLKQCQ